MNITNPSRLTRILFTTVLVLLAAGAAVYLYQGYMLRPWTRDGQVRALIVNITPRVDGNVVKVHVADNQFVRKDDPLLEIDPSRYQLAAQSAEVNLQQQRQDVATLEAAIDSAQATVEAITASLAEAQKESARARAAGAAVSAEYVDQRATAVEVAAAQLSEAQAKLAEAKQNLGAPGEDNVRIQAAKVALDQAKLDLAWTTITAPSDGFVTNVTIEEGDYARVGTPLLAFVDSTSFWVSGYFMETQLRYIKVGDPAIMTLMAHPDKPLGGEVESFGRAISPPHVALVDGLAGLVPQIEPTFDWVRLAQRVPVRVKITQVPQGVELIAGTTASVAVRPR
jgi:multidrug resistance efflux pump